MSGSKNIGLIEDKFTITYNGKYEKRNIDKSAVFDILQK